MGICAECIYKGEKKVPSSACRRFSENYVCTNLENAEIDYITGDTILSSCRVKNQFGECEFFDDGKEYKTYYAWGSPDAFYTESKTPDVNDFIYNADSETVGTIDDVKVYTVWKSTDNQIVYTLTKSPEIGSDVYYIEENDFILLGMVEDVTAKGIIIRGANFELSDADDIIFVDGESRNPYLDFTVRVPRAEFLEPELED